MADSLTWIEPNGTQHDLTDPNSYFWTPGAQGMWMPTIQFQGQQIPLQPGEIPRLILAGPRDVLVPIMARSAISRADLFNKLEQLASMFYTTNPQKPGILRRTTPNGHVRDLNCFYLDGAKGDESVDNSGVGHMAMVINLHASDPFWYDSDYTQLTFTPTGIVDFFQVPIFPLHLSPDGESDAFTINNTGDEKAYPIWQIIGPCANPVFTNTFVAENGATLTKTLSLSISLSSGETLTVVTKPGSGSIKKQDGSNQFSALSDFTSSLWPLVPGNNSCGVALSSPGAGTQVVLKYKQAYLTP